MHTPPRPRSLAPVLLVTLALFTACESPGGLNTDGREGGLESPRVPVPVGLNPGQDSLMATLGATLGQVLGRDDYSVRDLGEGDKIEAVKKARSYQESIEKKGKSKEVTTTLEKLEAIYAVPITVSTGSTMEVVFMDPATRQPADGKVYTIPKVADNTVIEVGGKKVLVNPGG